MRAKVASAERRNSAPSPGSCSSYHRRAPCMSSSASGRRTRRRVTPQPRGVCALLPKGEQRWDLRGGRRDGGPARDGATREQAPTLHLRRCCPTGLRPARFARPRGASRVRLVLGLPSLEFDGLSPIRNVTTMMHASCTCEACVRDFMLLACTRPPCRDWRFRQCLRAKQNPSSGQEAKTIRHGWSRCRTPRPRRHRRITVK